MRYLQNFVAAAVLAALSLLGHAAPALAQVVAGEEHCVVNVAANDRLNMREHPHAWAPVVTTLPYATCGITVTDVCVGAWCPAEDGHFAGWVHSRYISMVSPARYCVANVPAGDRLNLRAYPSTISRILTRLPRHQCEIAFLPYRIGNWQKVRAVGYEGWVNLRYISGQ